MTKIPKKYLVIGGIILIILFIIVQLLTPKKISPLINTPPLATPSATITPRVNYTESTKEWNDFIKKDLEKYNKTDKARIDQTLSVVRLKSPIIQTDFTVEYSYRTATYTITLKQPADASKQNALLWLKNLGISSEDLKTVRVDWVTAP